MWSAVYILGCPSSSGVIHRAVSQSLEITLPCASKSAFQSTYNIWHVRNFIRSIIKCHSAFTVTLIIATSTMLLLFSPHVGYIVTVILLLQGFFGRSHLQDIMVNLYSSVAVCVCVCVICLCVIYPRALKLHDVPHWTFSIVYFLMGFTDYTADVSCSVDIINTRHYFSSAGLQASN